MTQSQSSKLVDSCQGDSILSLLPPTLRDSKVPMKSNDLEAIHQHMTSLALENPGKHFEEAKSIIDGGSKFPNTKGNSEPNMKENENPQKNRPALARKRAKFSMKLDTSQPTMISEPTFQMDQLRDPEDFFAAYEKCQKTVKELKRQRGEDPNEPKFSTTARQRRPELPRRKISYQHHVYSSQPENDTVLSQETLQDTIKSQPIDNSHHESVTPNSQSKEKQVAGSVTKPEDRLDKLFDDLMSSDIANLDGDAALSYLKDRLKMKPVAIDDLQLPDFHDSVNLIIDQTRVSDTRSFRDNLLENTLGRQKRSSDKPLNSLSSPTSSTSPLLAISTFGKLLSKSIETESDDPFSAHDIDMIPTTTTSEIISRPSTHASKDNLSELPISMEDGEQRHNMEEVDEDIQANAEDMVKKAASPAKLHLNVEDITDNDQDRRENAEHATEKVWSSSLPEENIEIATQKESENDCFNSAQTDNSSINVPDASLPVQNPDIVPEQQNEEHPKTSKNNRKKTRARKIDLKKKRHSLAGGGSSWTTGVRRSNRIKTKPLEYWKGERLLYARVHNSLPTVVGVKYISPSKPGFKVESFVADKYKDLVDLISLH